MNWTVYDTAAEEIVYEHGRREFCESMKEAHFPSDRFQVQEKYLVPDSYSEFVADLKEVYGVGQEVVAV